VTELPLAGSGCALDEEGAARQADRYAALGASLTGIERGDRRLVARFGADLDQGLLREALDIERGCCPFFSIAFDPRERRLELSVPDQHQAPALDALLSALTRMGAWDGSTRST